MKKLVCIRLFFCLIVPILFMGMAWSKSFKNPLREISVIVTNEGFYPNKIAVFEGERVRFFVTSTVEEPQCMVIDRHKIFLGAVKGKMSEGEAIFNTPGKYKFYCPSSKAKGSLTVIGKSGKTVTKVKKVVTESESKRTVAGKVDDPAFWIPRNY